MTALILSDSHGKADMVARAVRQAGRVDLLLFLGDGLRDLYGLEESMPVVSVRGNCDLFSFFGDNSVPEERIIRLGEYTVLMMHGHTAGVKASYVSAAERAARLGADILLFGHTHQRFERYLGEGTELLDLTLKKPLYIFNPGSIGQPREGCPSFGLMTLRDNGVLLSHGEPEI